MDLERNFFLRWTSATLQTVSHAHCEPRVHTRGPCLTPPLHVHAPRARSSPCTLLVRAPLFPALSLRLGLRRFGGRRLAWRLLMQLLSRSVGFCSILTLFRLILLYFVVSCSVLLCSVVFCSVLFCSILFYSILLYRVLLYCVLLSSVLFCCILFCFILFRPLTPSVNPVCSILFYSILFCCIVFWCIVFCSLLFYSVLFYCVPSSHLVCHPSMFYSILFYSILLYCMFHPLTPSPALHCLLFRVTGHRAIETALVSIFLFIFYCVLFCSSSPSPPPSSSPCRSAALFSRWLLSAQIAANEYTYGR